MTAQMTIFDKPATTDYGKKYKNARDRVFFLLSDRKWHTWQELREIGGLRYGARIHELKREGYRIESIGRKDDVGKVYRLITLEQFRPQAKRVKVYLYEKDAHALLAFNLPDSARNALADALDSFDANKGNL